MKNETINTNKTIKLMRLQAGLSGWIVCLETGVSRSRLSAIEKGITEASAEELNRIAAGIERLRQAKSKVVQFAARCGFPI